ncbi:hypothetical protein [Streptomyces sp. SS]|nr:hypothetical protein [Streptomyces sp. SS]
MQIASTGAYPIPPPQGGAAAGALGGKMAGGGIDDDLIDAAIDRVRAA